jgi:translation elongation factor P/translation initiation factor 5A
LKKIVEALLNDESTLSQPSSDQIVIKYLDKDDELINVSDDEDLQTAYEVAKTENEGNLKFVLEFKKPVSTSTDKV